MNTEATPGDLGSTEWLGRLVDAVGMVNYLNYGAASHVSSEGCHGVTQEHLEQFADLVRAAEGERWAKLWKRHAYATLGMKRDSMSAAEIEAVQRFLGPLET